MNEPALTKTLTDGRTATVTLTAKAADAIREQLNSPEPVVWSVVCGVSPYSRAVEPAPLDIEIPDDVLEWASKHGLSVDDPDVYILVTPEDEAGEVSGEIAYMTGQLPGILVAAIRRALDTTDDTQQ